MAGLQPKMDVVPVPGLGKVRLRELSAPEVVAIRDTTKAKKDDFGFYLVIRSVVDESGAAIFADEDLASLQGSGQNSIGKLVSAVMKHNGFQVQGDEAKN
ncbi:MAG TPA: hypothetical protein VGK09_08380 [Rhodocyclaceae bacterium]